MKTVLSVYFQPSEDQKTRLSQLAWWCDELEDWSADQIRFALRQWNRENPRIRPTPGDILKILSHHRGVKEAERRRERLKAAKVEESAPTGPRVSKEKADSILAEFGFKRFPKAGEAAE